MDMPAVLEGGVAKRSPVLRRTAVRAHVSRCTLAQGRPEFHGEHRCARVAVVLQGRFRYRARSSEALLTRGALLMAKAGEGYSKLALDPGGDLCLVFEYGENFLRQAGVSPQLATNALAPPVYFPADPGTTADLTLLERAVQENDEEALEIAAYRVAEIAMSATRAEASTRPLTTDQAGRVLAVVRYIEENFAEDCSLQRLSELVETSSFHLLRLFKRHTGQTPRQFLLAQRLAFAAKRLLDVKRRVIHVALDSGFSDISHFNAAFRRCYGVSPIAYRSRLRRI